MTNLPNFIVQSPPLSDPQWPPPYRFENVAVQLFQVLADGKKLQDTCDRFLNYVAKANRSPLRIDPLMGTLPGIVNIMMLRYPRVYCDAKGYENMGFTSQNELTFAIPVVLRDHGIPVSVGFFIPFLFVDNNMSLISGRDTVGFQKARGSFSLSADPSKVDGFEMKTLAAKAFTRNDCFDAKPLLATQRAELLAGEEAPELTVLSPDVAKTMWPYGPVDQLYFSGQQFSVDEKVLELIRKDAGVTMGNYSLKQFRDAQYPGHACYQSIVGADTNIYEFEAGGFLPKSTLTLHSYPNLDIAQQMGLHMKSNGVSLKPITATWYHASFRFENLQNLVVRSGAPGNIQRPHSCLPLFVAGTRAMLSVYGQVAKAGLRTLETIARDQQSRRRR